MTVSIGLGRVGSKFFHCSGLGWVSQLTGWVGSGQVTQNGPMDNSGPEGVGRHVSRTAQLSSCTVLSVVPVELGY